MANTFQIKPQGQKLATLNKEYLPSYWTSDTNMWMAYLQGGNLFAHKKIFTNSKIWLSYYMLKNVPHLIPSFIYILKMNSPHQFSEACTFVGIYLYFLDEFH